MPSSNSVICLLFVVAFVASITPSQAAMEPCPSCDDDYVPVWATDGQGCQEYHNSCELESVNCSRLNEGESALRRISQAECKWKNEFNLREEGDA